MPRVTFASHDKTKETANDDQNDFAFLIVNDLNNVFLKTTFKSRLRYKCRDRHGICLR